MVLKNDAFESILVGNGDKDLNLALLPSSCDSPMSLPNFSPPVNHYQAPTHEHVPYVGGQVGQEGQQTPVTTCAFDAPAFNKDLFQRQHYNISGDGEHLS